LKGGAELSVTPLAQLWAPMLFALLLGAAIPIWCYAILRALGKFSVADSAAIAAHYGSVSAVTFSACLTFLESIPMPYEGFVPALVAVMEIPGIIVALVIARMRLGQVGSWRSVLHEVLTGRSILLLFGGLVIGLAAGKEGFAQVTPLFVDPFKGALTFFLLEMGMVAARQFRDVAKAGKFFDRLRHRYSDPPRRAWHLARQPWRVSSPGGSMVLGVLAASASYIAAPAAVRIALPQANPGYYLTASLVITFPFNLTLGLPIYFAMTRAIFGI